MYHTLGNKNYVHIGNKHILVAYMNVIQQQKKTNWKNGCVVIILTYKAVAAFEILYSTCTATRNHMLAKLVVAVALVNGNSTRRYSEIFVHVQSVNTTHTA
jgi:hypothetical protein